jgi:hypothetical protein
MDWNHLARDTDQRHTLVDTVMKYRVHKVLGIEVSEQLLPSQDILCSVELLATHSGNCG